MNAGTRKSASSGKTVTKRKRAIAIGLSKAREAGAKVPPKKTPAKKSDAKKTAVKKAPASKTAKQTSP